MSTYVITGSNRGIGLEMCRQLTKQGHQVIAVCRQASSELQKLNVTIIDNIDVAQDDVIQALQHKCKDLPHIDVLINMAGILYRETLKNMNYDTMRQQYEINALGPIRITQALLSKLQPGSKIAYHCSGFS